MGTALALIATLVLVAGAFYVAARARCHDRSARFTRCWMSERVDAPAEAPAAPQPGVK